MASCTAQQAGLQHFQEGLYGQVLWLEGNLMPRMDESEQALQSRSSGKGIQRIVHIYPAVSAAQVPSEKGFFDLSGVEKLATLQTDDKGRFFIALPPGTYSIFSEEEEGLWANVFDANNTINPVVIEAGQITSWTFEINYKAAY
jgi:hypothetical protein